MTMGSLFPSVTARLPAISRPSPMYKSTNSRVMSWMTYIMTVQSLFTSVAAKSPAISRPSPKYNSTKL